MVAKERADNICITSILPRADDKVDLKKVEHVNELLTTTANAAGASFVNNDLNFKYRDETVDLTLLSPTDKVHLSASGVIRLLQNLKLQDKAKPTFGQGPINRWSDEKKAHVSKSGPSPSHPPQLVPTPDANHSPIRPVQNGQSV